ncbi:hypothetical protein B0X71_20045 (plasmid) [Planococcus lenghuensis]|uniref:Uncharacterized protein n=1 Tax=Planococcus lenghuensis TaxID=2213202 RepID=A0A1Q2L513_9BACL|nr:hypothetical protein B0X71_20045 [Planococcus lenghuensis]
MEFVRKAGIGESAPKIISKLTRMNFQVMVEIHPFLIMSPPHFCFEKPVIPVQRTAYSMKTYSIHFQPIPRLEKLFFSLLFVAFNLTFD